MVFMVAWSCLISVSKSVAATKGKATSPARHGARTGSAATLTRGWREVLMSGVVLILIGLLLGFVGVRSLN